MKSVCPYCDWPEFTPFRPLEQVRSGLLGLLARFRRTGKIVVCARCAEQYAIGETGAYRLAPDRKREEPVESESDIIARRQREEQIRKGTGRQVDEDQAPLWTS